MGHFPSLQISPWGHPSPLVWPRLQDPQWEQLCPKGHQGLPRAPPATHPAYEDVGWSGELPWSPRALCTGLCPPQCHCPFGKGGEARVAASPQEAGQPQCSPSWLSSLHRAPTRPTGKDLSTASSSTGKWWPCLCPGTGRLSVPCSIQVPVPGAWGGQGLASWRRNRVLLCLG